MRNAAATVVNWTRWLIASTIGESSMETKGGDMRMCELRRISLAVVTLIALLAAPGAHGQQATGAITGVVTDPSGAAVKGAAVTVTDTERGTSQKVQTISEGVYNFPQVSIGQYSVRVEASGFQSAVRSNVMLELNLTATIDFKMNIGQVSQTLEVTDAA